MKSEVDRRAADVILTMCGLDVKELAEQIGYEPGYISNVLSGATRPSPAFRRAFGETIATLVFGDSGQFVGRLPAKPLVELVRRRARLAPCKRDFYAQAGINMSYLVSREWLSEPLVDRICSALGVHPSALYGGDCAGEEAS